MRRTKQADSEAERRRAWLTEYLRRPTAERLPEDAARELADEIAEAVRQGRKKQSTELTEMLDGQA